MQVMAAADNRPLVLLVDPQVESRHWLWRRLNDVFGILEATTARGARQWIEERPDIDALITADELPDARGAELVAELAEKNHPIASRSIVLASPEAAWRKTAFGISVVDRGDIRALLALLTAFIPQARALLKRFAR